MDLSGICMDLTGIWKVIVTGPWWFKAFNWLRDKKVIEGDAGHNVSYGKKWGKFEVIVDWEKSLFFLKYKNGRIKDKVWFVNEDKLSGKFYWNGRFIGNFEMIRQEKS